MFWKKKIKALEEKIEAYKELTDGYQEALAAKEETIKRFYAWNSGVKRVTASYTITESDLNKFNGDRIPKVAKERMAAVIGRRIAACLEPGEILDANGNISGYEFDIEVRSVAARERPEEIPDYYRDADGFIWNEII